MMSGYGDNKPPIIVKISPAHDVFNMKEQGADNTGSVAIDSLLDEAQASGKKIYLPKGTYHIDFWRPEPGKGKVHLVGDGMNSTTLRVRSTLRPYDDWIVEDIEFVLAENAVAGSVFGIDRDANGNDHNFTMLRCRCTTEQTTNPSFVSVHVTNSKYLRFRDNEFLYGGINIAGAEYFWIEDNVFNSYFLSENEQIHANEDCSGIISGNRMYNSAADFIDLYVNSKSVVVENNHCEGFLISAMEIKVIFRDIDAENGYGNESNLKEPWENLTVKNNHFSGGRAGGTQMFNLSTTDERTNPTKNDFQNYGRFLTFENNFIDDTKLDGTEYEPLETDSRIVFALRGLANVNILNNKIVMNKGVKRVFYLSTDTVTDDAHSQISKNIRIEGNQIVQKYGYDSTVNMRVFYGGNIDGLIVKNNTFPLSGTFLDNRFFPITNAVFESNLFDNMNNEVLQSSDRHVLIYVSGSSITFKDMALHGLLADVDSIESGSPLNLDFFNCTFTNTLLLAKSNLLRFVHCKFKAPENTAIIFRSAVTTLFLDSCHFDSGFDYFYLEGGQYITNYFPRDIYTDTARSSLWNGAPPTKTDLSSKY